MDPTEKVWSSRINKFRDLIFWRQAIAFITSVYKLTTSFPANELSGINLNYICGSNDEYVKKKHARSRYG
jgi:hypothetical protein